MWIQMNIPYEEWDRFIKYFNGNIKQSFNWGEVKKLADGVVLDLFIEMKIMKLPLVQFLFKLKFFQLLFMFLAE